MIKKIDLGLLIILSIGLIILSLIALPNHFNFRTYALDYGVFNQAMYAYSNGEPALFTQGWAGDECNYLCDHFSLLTVLLSPLRFLFGSYTLILVQIIALLFSCFYMWKLSKEYTSDLFVQYVFACSPLCIWGVYGAVSSEFHMNVVSAAFFPAIYFYLIKGDWKKLVLFTLIAILGKENIGLNLFALFLAGMIENWNKPMIRNVAALFGVISISYMFLCITMVPKFYCGDAISNTQTFYSYFGANLNEAMLNMISNPLDLLRLSFQDFEGNVAKAKVTSIWFFVLSGGIFALLRPSFLLPFVILFAQKFLSSNQMLWDTNGHYSIEIALLIPIAMVCSMRLTIVKTFQRVIFVLSLTIALFMSWRGIISRNVNSNLFDRRHYQAELSRDEFAKVQSFLSDGEVISCTTNLSPHLSFRKRIYVFPVVKDSKWIVLDKNASVTYPLRKDEYDQEIKELRENIDFQVYYESNSFVVFRNVNAIQPQQ